MKRQMSVAGSFYPNESDEIKRFFTHFEENYDEQLSLPDIKTRAVIVPHAGYVYSGFTASVAYRLLAKSGVKKFAIIGPSHKFAFDGISLGNFDEFVTPLGSIKQDDVVHKKIQDKFSLDFKEEVHIEHSTELQFPFLKHYIDDAKMIELIYSKCDAKSISEIINLILDDKEYGVIISTDLSHFHEIGLANKLDNICLNALNNLDIDKLNNGCEACGFKGVEAMMLSAIELGYESNILDYKTSADVNEDKSSVVGYMSACFT